MRVLTMASCLVGLFSFAFALDVRRAGSEEGRSAKLPEGYVEEGPLPRGFPPPSETGVVVEKTYPAARSYSATGDDAFMKCFRYLSANDHEMTAPVVIEYDAEHLAAGPTAPTLRLAIPFERMHFLLETPSIDEPRESGEVLVADMPPQRVLSFAFQGQLNGEAVGRAQQRIKAYLAAHEGIEAAGEFRLLGYNSPMISREKQYWEVQFPIQQIKASNPLSDD